MTRKSTDQILYELQNLDIDFGIYPKAVKGYGDERDYEQRDGFKNGWNACIMEYGKKFCEIAYSGGSPWCEYEKIFASGPCFEQMDGIWGVMLNDTWYYACSDFEEIKPEEYKDVVKYYHNYGYIGVLYWVYLKRGHLPGIDYTEKEVLAVKALEEFKAYYRSDKGKEARKKKYLRQRRYKKLLKPLRKPADKIKVWFTKLRGSRK